jgi:hypothetical protein
MDRNNDGMVAIKEWTGPIREFREWDVNDNGVLTRAEFNNKGALDENLLSSAALRGRWIATTTSGCRGVKPGWAAASSTGRTPTATATLGGRVHHLDRTLPPPPLRRQWTATATACSPTGVAT